jgi:hypothetical protein
VNPWDEGDEQRRPAPSRWGCALAAIIASVAFVVAAVLVLTFANGLANDVLGDLW